MATAVRDKDEDKLKTLQVLAEDSLLRRLPTDELSALLRQASIRSFAERSTIFEQGDAGRSLFVVSSGYVKLSSVTLGGREVVFDLAAPGAVFGELAVLNDWPRAATATALSATVLLAVDGRQFTSALSRTPAAMLGVIRLLSQRLRRTTDQLTDGVDLPAHVRLAKALLQLAALHSHPVPGGLQIGLQLSQRELGGMTGLIRESINKHLGIWRDEGWLRMSARTVTLCNLAAFRALAHEHELD